jgi:hypothetical protein
MVYIVKVRADLDFVLTKLSLKNSIGFSPDSSFWLSWCGLFSRGRVFPYLDDYQMNRRFGIVNRGAKTGRLFAGISHDAEDGTITLPGTIVRTIDKDIVIGPMELMSSNMCLSPEGTLAEKID